MKTLTVLAVLFLLAGGTVQAGDMSGSTTGTVAEAQEGTAVNNKICPISGEKVGEMGPPVQVEHEGQIYNLCCEMCAKDFYADPEGYISAMEEAGEMDEMEMDEAGHEGHEHE